MQFDSWDCLDVVYYMVQIRVVISTIFMRKHYIIRFKSKAPNKMPDLSCTVFTSSTFSFTLLEDWIWIQLICLARMKVLENGGK